MNNRSKSREARRKQRTNCRAITAAQRERMRVNFESQEAEVKLSLFLNGGDGVAQLRQDEFARALKGVFRSGTEIYAALLRAKRCVIYAQESHVRDEVMRKFVDAVVHLIRCRVNSGVFAGLEISVA